MHLVPISRHGVRSRLLCTQCRSSGTVCVAGPGQTTTEITLNGLLDALKFDGFVIFVESVQDVTALDERLVECSFPSIVKPLGRNQETSL